MKSGFKCGFKSKAKRPFPYGNDRVGRTLLNYFLMTYGEPPVIVYNEDKKEYYQALERYDADEEIDALTEVLRKQTVKTWGKALERNQGAAKQPKKKLTDFE